MFFGHLDHFDQERRVLPALVVKGLDYLRTHDLLQLSPGRHDLDSERMYAAISEYTTTVKDERSWEAHGQYLDIQYVAAGQEIIGYAPRSASLTVTEDLLAHKDVVFYKTVPTETELLLSPGWFAVFFPWDVHRPGCTAGEAGLVRKVVIKIKISGLY